jgi:hypothetical protein
MVSRMDADTSPSLNLDAPVLCEAYNEASVDVMEVTILSNLRSDLVTDLKLIHVFKSLEHRRGVEPLR